MGGINANFELVNSEHGHTDWWVAPPTHAFMFMYVMFYILYVFSLMSMTWLLMTFSAVCECYVFAKLSLNIQYLFLCMNACYVIKH